MHSNIVVQEDRSFQTLQIIINKKLKGYYKAVTMKFSVLSVFLFEIINSRNI